MTGTLGGVLTITERAADALRAADAAARRFNPEARVRLRVADGTLVADLVEGPAPGERTAALADVDIVVPEALDGTIDSGDHNTFELV